MDYLLVAVIAFFAGAGTILVWAINARAQAKLAKEQLTQAQAQRAELDQQRARITDLLLKAEAGEKDLAARRLRADDLLKESERLKKDLNALAVLTGKLELERREQATHQIALNERSTELAERYLADVEKWVGQSINANNYAACKERLTKAIGWCRGIGFDVSKQREEELLSDLKADFELAVKVALEKEEQARIKAQIREEQAREKEVQRELAALERERAAIKAALDKALADAKDQHSEEVERLRARLAEAEARNERTVAQAQLTRAGNIYVISNIGAFGESVFKIGMTRRLDPYERVQELSDASVPFPFDVHMMIAADDAPSLENELHRHFHKHRLNRVNPRKEFFKCDLDEIRKVVEAKKGEVRYVASPEALEYRQSVAMSEEDQAYIDRVFSDAESSLGVRAVDD
jgi:hypothetical protein